MTEAVVRFKDIGPIGPGLTGAVSTSAAGFRTLGLSGLDQSEAPDPGERSGNITSSSLSVFGSSSVSIPIIFGLTLS